MSVYLSGRVLHDLDLVMCIRLVIVLHDLDLVMCIRLVIECRICSYLYQCLRIPFLDLYCKEYKQNTKKIPV